MSTPPLNDSPGRVGNGQGSNSANSRAEAEYKSHPSSRRKTQFMSMPFDKQDLSPAPADTTISADVLSRDSYESLFATGERWLPFYSFRVAEIKPCLLSEA